MQIETAVLVGVLYGISTYLILKKSFVRILFGFAMLTNATNLFIVSMSGDPEGKRSPVLTGGMAPAVDPLPQALVLTAIVIGFGLVIYLIMLLYRIFLDSKTTNLEVLFRPEPEDE